MDCVICQIIAKTFPVEILFENENILCYLDPKPDTPGHMVVTPKTHVATIMEIDEVVSVALVKGLQQAVKLNLAKLQPKGFNFGWNHGAAAGQMSPHLHMHVLPRWSEDGGGNIHSIIKKEGLDAEVIKQKILS